MDDGVGAKLRDARTRRKITLGEVEAATKIRCRYLRAIENEEWDVLPGDAYARAFVRAYAAHLGLDGDRMADEYRRRRGVPRPSERLAGGEPPRRRRRPRDGGPPKLPPRVLAVAVSAALVGLLVALGLSGGSGDSQPSPTRAGGGKSAQARETGAKRRREEVSARPAAARGLELALATEAEVWVCLLDAKGEALVNGQILPAGAAEGPYRSASFTLSLGNGEVEMTVNGKRAQIPETAGPIGLEIDGEGTLRELPESERPTCT